MKHIYNTMMVARTLQPDAKALGTATSSKIISLMLVCLFLLVSGESMGQATFTARASGAWNEATTWSTISTAIPGAGDIVIINGGFNVTVTSNVQCASVTIQNSSSNNILPHLTLSNSATLEVNTFSLLGGNGQRKVRFTANNGMLRVNSSLTMTSVTGTNAEFEAGTGTVEYNGTGSTQSIANVNYHNLILSGSGTKTVSAMLTIPGNLTVNGNASFETGSFSHTVNGNLDIAHTGASIRGNSTVAGLSLTVGGNVTNSGTIALQTHALTVANNFTNNAGSTFTAGSGTHTIGGNWSNAGAVDGGTGTVTLNGVAKTISSTGSGAFNNLSLSGTGAKTAASNLAVLGNLTINNGATFDASTFSHTISGNLNNAGNFTPGTSAVEMNGTGRSISFTGTGAFNNLTLSNGAKSLSSNVTVNGTLALTNAILSTGANRVILGNTASISAGENAAQNVTGTVETTRSVVSGATQSFGNIGFAIVNSNANFGQVTVTRTTGTSHIERNERSANRQYSVSSTSGTGITGTSVTMRFPTHDLNDPIEETYDLYKFAGTSIARLAERVPNDPISISTVSDISGMYTLYSSQIAPLPVELISFSAQRQTKGVNLTWATASELDNSGFEVEVSTDSRNFQKIGFVESKVGTTSIRQNYSFLDSKAVSGTRYYRLKQVDLDGKFEYSVIKAISLDGSNGIAEAYPNPFSDVVVVKLTGTEARQVKAIITDAMGKVVLETSENTAGNSISLNTAHITTKGIYILHVLDNGDKHSFKLIKR